MDFTSNYFMLANDSDSSYLLLLAGYTFNLYYRYIEHIYTNKVDNCMRPNVMNATCMVMEDVRSIIHAICCHDVVNYSHEKLFNIIQLNLHKMMGVDKVRSRSLT